MSADKVSLHQLWTGTLTVLLVSAFYTLPRAVTLAVLTAAPWAIVAAGLLALLMIWPVLSTLAQRPGQNLINLACDAGGRPLAIAVALGLGAMGVSIAGLNLRQTSELVVSALYPHTPQTFAMASLIGVSALVAAMTPAGLLWVASLAAWPTLITIAIVLVGNFGWGQFRNALPATGYGLLPTAAEILPLTSHFTPLAHLLVFCGLLSPARSLPRVAVLATVTATLAWSLVLLFALMVFPLPGGIGVPFPLFEMSRLVQGGRFLERMDAVWIVIWAFGSAIRTGLALMLAAVLVKDAFRLPNHRDAVLPLAVAVLSVALFPSNQEGAITAESFLLRRWAYVGFLVIPLLITLAARVRKPAGRGGSQRGGSSGA